MRGRCDAQRVAVRVVETTTAVGSVGPCWHRSDGPPPPCDGALAYLNPTCGEALPVGTRTARQQSRKPSRTTTARGHSPAAAADLGDDPPTWEEPSQPPPQAGTATRRNARRRQHDDITTGSTYSINGVEHRLNGTIRRYAVASNAGMVIPLRERRAVRGQRCIHWQR